MSEKEKDKLLTEFNILLSVGILALGLALIAIYINY
jgi:hypothetical protein